MKYHLPWLREVSRWVGVSFPEGVEDEAREGMMKMAVTLQQSEL